VHPGGKVVVTATLLPWHGEPRNVRVPITLPANLPAGPVRLVVSDGAVVDGLMHPPQFGAKPLNIADTIAQLNSAHPSDHLYVTLLAPEAQAALDGRTLSALPLSVANVLEPLHQNKSMALNGESAVLMASVPLDAVISGRQVVTLQVKNQ
jgi:hypothetical protein